MPKRYNQFFRDAVALMGSTTIAKIIGLLLVPVVTRLFSPDDFGIVALILAIVMVFGTVSALRYDQAIVIPESDSEAGQLVDLSTRIIMLTGAVLFVAMFLLISYFPRLSLVISVGDWLYMIPFLVILTGYSEVLANWCTRKTHYKLIGASEMTVSLAVSGTRIVSGFMYGSSVLGLIAGNVLGLGAKILILFNGRNNNEAEKLKIHAGSELIETAYKYKEFPLFSAPTGILNSLFQKLPVIALGIMFLPGVVGLYAMAARMSRLPIDIVALPIRRIYMQRIAKQRSNGQKIHSLLIKTAIGLLLLGVLPFSLIAVFGETLFAFVLGEKWRMSGVYASILVPWLYTMFVVTPASSNFIVLKKQALWFRIQLYNGVLGFTVFSAGYLYGMSVEDLLMLFSILAMTANLIVFLIAYVMTFNADRDLSVSN